MAGAKRSGAAEQRPEKVQDFQPTPEVFENDIALYLRLFCEEQNIDDLTKISQNIWNAALMYIQRNVFKDRSMLKIKHNIINKNNIMDSTYNAYDYDLVDNICDMYIYICFMYDKEISAVGFSLLTGINNAVLIEWGKGTKKLSQKAFEIAEKIQNFREESLSAKLATANKNPVGILAILNRHYSWNLPGVTREHKQQALTAAELPKLGQAPELREIPEQLPDQDGG